MKITKAVNTGIRKIKTDEGKTLAIIGQVKELLEKEIIFEDNTQGNEDKWLAIELGKDSEPIVFNEFNTLESAKNYYKNLYKTP